MLFLLVELMRLGDFSFYLTESVLKKENLKLSPTTTHPRSVQADILMRGF